MELANMTATQVLMILYITLFIGFQIGAFLATRTKITFVQLLMICLFIKIVWGGGVSNPAVFSKVIQFAEIATLGNTTKFGELSDTRAVAGGASSSTRGLFMGGKNASGTDTIEFITIATQGNVTDFGNLVNGSRSNATAVSNSVEACCTGGGSSIDSVVIATTADSIDFTDLSQARSYLSACSDSHGGLAQ